MGCLSAYVLHPMPPKAEDTSAEVGRMQKAVRNGRPERWWAETPPFYSATTAGITPKIPAPNTTCWVGTNGKNTVHDIFPFLEHQS
jgi:hypothetical protein